MNNDFKIYVENTKKPWNELFYKMLWEQLPKIENCKVLDFGSGLGITSNYLAINNDVIAIEPDMDMVKTRLCENNYNQIIGGIEKLTNQSDNYFDVILCHNVFEYAKEREDIFKEFYRILKPNGLISIVKHNHNGRIMQKAIFENNIDEALSIFNGEEVNAAYFGNITFFSINDIKNWCSDMDINIEKTFGIRTFFGLGQNNEIKYEESWKEKMFQLEMKVSEIEDYKNIAFYNHILLRKGI